MTYESLASAEGSQQVFYATNENRVIELWSRA